MKYIKEHLSSIVGVEVFPIAALLIFVGLFAIATVWAFRTKKEKIEEMAQMPLED
jgi:cbb3-type cytochrome oxidase subunit 3